MVLGVTHIVSVDAPCPACKRSLAIHWPSAPSARGQAGGVVVVRGRCIVDGARAPQKLCWAPAAAPLSVQAYLKVCGHSPPPSPACPGCGGPTVRHGVYWRRVADDSVRPTPVPIYRFCCKRPDCPVVTITLYPPFITPYMPFPTAVREQAVRDHDEHHTPWDALARVVGVAPDTLRRWARRLRARAAALRAAFVAIVITSDALASLPPSRDGPSIWVIGDGAAHRIGLPSWPRLALTRLVLTQGPVPVWA
jgi:hypothetical protein